MTRFYETFSDIPVIGMLHLAGEDPVVRAIDELLIYDEQGVDGAIVENYHGSVEDVQRTLEALARINTNVVIGVNILPNEFARALKLANTNKGSFIQLDCIAGSYTRGNLLRKTYEQSRSQHPEILVFGGVEPKYYTTTKEHDRSKALDEAMELSDAIVVTGEGTGKETSLDKIRAFKEHLGGFPLIIGAGLTPENAYDQLMVAEGCIVGSTFKEPTLEMPSGDTRFAVDPYRVRDFMDVVRQVREDK